MKQYADRLDSTVTQIAAIADALVREWEASGALRAATDAAGSGLLRRLDFAAVELVDQQGHPIGAARHGHGANADFSKTAYFGWHQRVSAPALVVTDATTATAPARHKVAFSRRVQSRDGAFAGMVVVTVDASFLKPYVRPEDLGPLDFVGLAGADGAILASVAGSGGAAPQSVFRALRNTRAPSGSAAYAAAHFSDLTQRFVAWTTLTGYPLKVVAAVSEDQAFMPYAASVAHLHRIRFAVAVLLGLLSTAGMVVCGWVFWRRDQAREVKETYRLAIDAARDGFYMVKAIYGAGGSITDFEVADCNERGAGYYGKTRGTLVGMRFTDFVTAGAYVDEVIRVFSVAMRNGYYEDELEVPSASPLVPVWLHRKLMRSQEGLAVTLRDVSDTKANEAALVRLANHDTLTDLPNRNWLTNFLPAAVAEAREKRTGVGLLFLDLDNFKDVNDTQGHAVGDQVLTAVAARLRATVRQADRVSRLGGDEFNVIIADVDGRAMLLEAAHRIMAALKEPLRLADGTQHLIRASIGISLYPDDGETAETLITRADLAMYAAKDAGKGVHQFFSQDLEDTLRTRVTLEQALREAITGNQFVLHYQPRVNTVTGELCSMEALVRWMHPQRGLVAPGEFIQTAERTGLIVQLGEIVLDKACAQIAAWKAAGLCLVPVSVNVSPQQFLNGNLAALFCHKLEQYGVPANMVEAEITESAMMGDSEQISANLAAIEALGIKLLVDDFGTGYASLSQLQRLRLDGLKVDRAFTMELDRSHDGRVFYQAIISMAHALGMSVVAEGVETPEQLRVLQDMHCEEVQGYLVSRPVPAREMTALLKKRFLFKTAACVTA